MVAAEPHRRVGAEPARALEPGRVARRRDDAARAEQLRGLHGDLADDAARAEDEHGLARREPAAPLQPEPGGEPGDAEADGERRVEAVGHRVAAGPASISVRSANAPNGSRLYSK